MPRGIGLDHISFRVVDFERSRRFYSQLFTFLGFECIDAFSDTVGWRNGHFAFWISAAKNVTANDLVAAHPGFHHCAMELGSRKDVDDLQTLLLEMGAEIVDCAAEYYSDYYAIYFKDPDGLKLEGVAYGPRFLHGARRKRLRRRVPLPRPSAPL